MAYLTNLSFEFFHAISTEDVPLRPLFDGAKKAKMTKNSNKGGPALTRDRHLVDKSAQWTCKLRGGKFTKTRDTGIMTKQNIGIAFSAWGAADCFLVLQSVLVSK